MKALYQKLRADRALKIRLAFAFFIPGVLVSLVFSRLWPSQAELWYVISTVLYLTAYVVAGFDVIVRAIQQLKQKDWTNEYFLMTVATIGALILRAWSEAAAIMIFYEIGEYAQSVAIERSRESISDLMDLAADEALVRRDGNWVTVDPYEVEAGEEILIQAGAKVPIDGIIIEGQGELDTSGLTGEALPRSVQEGDEILSGSLNLNSVLVARTTVSYDESTINKIIELSGEASLRKGNTERLITRFSRYYTPIVIVIAFLVLFIPPIFMSGDWWVSLQRSMNMLVISCPCALVLSVPLSFFSGLGLASTKGILIKGGDVLENFIHSSKIVFDKTGTLTSGKLALEELVIVSPRMSRSEVLALASSLEQGSSHLIAEAIRKAAKDELTDEAKIHSQVTNLEELPGRGVKGDFEEASYYLGNARLMNDLGLDITSAREDVTAVYFARKVDSDGQAEHLARFYFSDNIKPEAPGVIQKLRDLGVKHIAMYSGDRKPLVEKQAIELGLDEYYGELLPQDKLTKLEEDIQNKPAGTSVSFVGDGINDAPALSLADVGIAMGHVGSDAAVEAADIVLIRDDLEAIPQAIEISRKTMRIAKQNIFLALGLKILIMILSIIGIGGMWLAIFADVGVTLICIINSFRITAGSSLAWIRGQHMA